MKLILIDKIRAVNLPKETLLSADVVAYWEDDGSIILLKDRLQRQLGKAMTSKEFNQRYLNS